MFGYIVKTLHVAAMNLKLLFQNFFEPIVLSNNQQHALTQDIIGKQ